MKKFFSRFLSLTLCFCIILSFISCSKTESDDYDFQEGVEFGMAETFMALYNASNLKNTKFLFDGDVWRTNHFLLTFTDEKIDNKTYLQYNLMLKDITIEACFEEAMLFFNIYEASDIQWKRVLTADDYYIYAMLENDPPLNGYHVKGTVSLSEEATILITIIVIDGHLYTAEYYL